MKENNTSEQTLFRDLLAAMTTSDRLMCPGELLRRAAIMYAETPALIYENQETTYRTLYEQVCACAHFLIQQGVQPRDRVIISLHNSPAFYISYCAAWHLGAIVTPLNTFLTESELQHIIHDARPAACIVDTTRVALFKSAGAHQALLTEHDILVASIGNVTTPPELVTVQPNECATLMYTSGTTGVPKGVMLSSLNIMTNIAQVMARLGLEHEGTDRIFAVLPLFHVFAQNTCFWASFFAGITVIIVPKIDRRAILDGLKHKPTLFIGVPALFGLLCLMKNAPLESVRLFASGGDMLPDKIRTSFALLYHRKIINGYGLTETSPVLAAIIEDEMVRVGTVGTPLVGVMVEIRDAQGATVPHGTSGQLWVSGDNIMIGYYQSVEETRTAFQENWFNTGDLAYIDSKGRIVFTGREKDLIITKGFNVYPPEVENVIMQHQNVVAAGVVGCPDPDIGEYVIAFVQVRNMQNDIQKELRALCANRIASYKIPRMFICSTDELPMTATRKIDKKILRKQCTIKEDQEDDHK